MKRSRVLTAFAVAALILGACGNDKGSEKVGGDRDADDQAYVDEMAAAMSEADEGMTTFPVAEMKCWVGDMADGIGVDKLKEAGFTAESLASESSTIDGEVLSDGDREVMVDSFNECVDVEAMFTGSMAAGDGEEDMPQEVKDCFADLDWDAQGAEFVEMVLTGEEPAQDSPANAALNECIEMGMGPGGDMGGEMEFDTDDSDTTAG